MTDSLENEEVNHQNGYSMALQAINHAISFLRFKQ